MGSFWDKLASAPMVGPLFESVGIGKSDTNKSREQLLKMMEEQQQARYRLAQPLAQSYERAIGQSMLPYQTAHQFSSAMLGVPNRPFPGAALSKSPLDMAMLGRDPMTGEPFQQVQQSGSGPGNPTFRTSTPQEQEQGWFYYTPPPPAPGARGTAALPPGKANRVTSGKKGMI